jgi:hypothetical protein
MALDTQGRALLDAIANASRAHRSRCASLSFQGDREACANVADAADAFIDGGGSRLLASSEAGDTDAHRRLMEGGQRILAAVGGAFSDIGQGLDVTDLVADIAETAKGAVTSKWWKVAAGAAVVVGGVALYQRVRG